MLASLIGLNNNPGTNKRYKIVWTQAMHDLLIAKFPVTFNRVLAKELGVSMRSLTREARKLGIEKIPGFLEKNRNEISRMAVQAHPAHPFKGVKGWCVPNSEKSRFQIGQTSVMSDPEICKRVHQKRNATIARDKIRRKYGLSPITKLKLVNL